MLTACATLPDKAPTVEPDPVIVTRTVVEKLCPAELELYLPVKVEMPAGMVVRANRLALDWLAAFASRADLIEQRLVDASLECAND